VPRQARYCSVLFEYEVVEPRLVPATGACGRGRVAAIRFLGCLRGTRPPQQVRPAKARAVGDINSRPALPIIATICSSVKRALRIAPSESYSVCHEMGSPEIPAAGHDQLLPTLIDKATCVH
jgi:hypothetical protein